MLRMSAADGSATCRLPQPRIWRRRLGPTTMRAVKRPEEKSGNERPTTMRAVKRPEEKSGNERPTTMRAVKRPEEKSGNERPTTMRAVKRPEEKSGNKLVRHGSVRVMPSPEQIADTVNRY